MIYSVIRIQHSISKQLFAPVEDEIEILEDNIKILEDEILEDQESNRILRPRIKPRYIIFNLVFFFFEDFRYT